MKLTLNDQEVCHQIIPTEGFKILSERRVQAYDCPNDIQSCKDRGNAEAKCYDVMTEVRSGIDRCCNICQLKILK